MSKTIGERELVLAILLEVTRDKIPAHLALSRVLGKYQYLDKRERAFITKVTEGTLEHMIEIDYIIDQFSKIKIQKMKPVVLAILRSGVYQLRYLDHVPASAVCNEAVKLAKKKGLQGLSGFINGVLRTIAREMEHIRLPQEPPATKLSVQYSVPKWMVEKWMAVYQEETVEKMLASMMEEHPTCIRFDPERISKDTLKARLKEDGVAKIKDHPALPYALWISGYDYLGALSTFEDGLFYVQDASSMIAVESLQVRQGDYIIDVCAAPGGKALHAAEKLAGTGKVDARDLTDYKVKLIEENIARSGLTNIRARRQDARILEEASVEQADIVIADLPCSGLGVLASKKDIRYNMTPEKQAELAALQREILSVVCRYVKPGGTLLYSTCTINREDNEENTAWFLGDHGEFMMEKERQFLPGIDPCEGFYIAVLKKQESE